MSLKLAFSRNIGSQKLQLTDSLQILFINICKTARLRVSFKTWFMPVVSQHLLSATRLSKQRQRVEQRRLRSASRHVVHYFHQVDDPYCALTASALAQLLARYDVDIQAHVVGAPSDAAAPEREKLMAYSRKDAQRLARHYRLSFTDSGFQPSAASVRRATVELVHSIAAGRFVQRAAAVSSHLWHAGAGDAPAMDVGATHFADTSAVDAHLAASAALRGQWGHYLGATFFYAGEWYWGIDRLHHLELRLQSLGAQRAGLQGYLFAPPSDLQHSVALDQPSPIEFFFSLRSPYSAIVAARVFELGRRTGAPVHLRYVLPMVMRGLPVPKAKRHYIALDAAREARAHGVPFGRINDPVGKPAERGLSIIPYAEREGLGQAYVLSFMRGVWAEGLDAGSDRGLRTIVHRAGLSWDRACDALTDQHWRTTAEANRQELFEMGLWGVPSFRVGAMAVWGQDRLWVVQEALLQAGNGSEFRP